MNELESPIPVDWGVTTITGKHHIIRANRVRETSDGLVFSLDGKDIITFPHHKSDNSQQVQLTDEQLKAIRRIQSGINEIWVTGWNNKKLKRANISIVCGDNDQWDVLDVATVKAFLSI